MLEPYYKHIGVAFSVPHPPNNRKYEYNILIGECGSKYIQYAGYREGPGGKTMVGLPLAGPNNCYDQPILPFDDRLFPEVRFFVEERHGVARRAKGADMGDGG